MNKKTFSNQMFFCQSKLCWSHLFFNWKKLLKDLLLVLPDEVPTTKFRVSPAELFRAESSSVSRLFADPELEEVAEELVRQMSLSLDIFFINKKTFNLLNLKVSILSSPPHLASNIWRKSKSQILWKQKRWNQSDERRKAFSSQDVLSQAFCSLLFIQYSDRALLTLVLSHLTVVFSTLISWNSVFEWVLKEHFEFKNGLFFD